MSDNHTTLTGFADLYGSDKGTRHHAPHGYSLFYDMLFAGRRKDKMNVLELGLQIATEKMREKTELREGTQAPSIAMWSNYFPNSKIYGADISDFSNMTGKNFQFIHADLSCQKDIEKILDLQITFDIIIDDASHATYDQKLCFANLFPVLRENGLYIVEDLQWQPERTEKYSNRGLLFSEYVAFFNKYGVFPHDSQFNSAEINKLGMDINYVHLNTVGNVPENRVNQCIIHKLRNSKNQYFSMKKNNELKNANHRLEAAHTLAGLYPDCPDVGIETVKCYVDNAKYSEARQIIKDRTMEHQLPQASLIEVLCLINLDKIQLFESKIQEFEKHIFKDSEVTLAYIQLLLSNGYFEFAETVVNSFTEKHNDRPLFDFKIGKAFIDAGLLDKGIEFLEKAVLKLPDRRQFQIAIISALAKGNKIDELQIQLRASLSQFPNDSRIVQLAARCFMRNGIRNKALSLIANCPDVLKIDEGLNKYYSQAC